MPDTTAIAIATDTPADARCDSLETRYERLRYAYGNLIESYEELTEQLHELRDIHLVTDGVGVVLQVNAAGSLISPARRLIGTRLSDWIVRRHHDQFLSLLVDISKQRGNSGKTWSMRVQRDTPDALQIDVLLQALPVVNDGEVSVIHWVLRPVKQQVEESFQLLRPPVAFEHITECGLKTDANGVILTVNDAFVRTTGYTAQDVIGKTPRILSSGLQDEAFYKDLWADLLSTGRWKGLLFNRRKSGEIYCEWLTIRAETDSAGRKTGYIAVFFDLGVAVSKKQHLIDQSSPPNVYRTQPIESAVGETDRP
jgi:PAS domain S-box-containing protein